MKLFVFLPLACLLFTASFYALSLQMRTVYQRQLYLLEQHRLGQQFEELVYTTRQQQHAQDVQVMSHALFTILNASCSLCYIQTDCHAKEKEIQDNVNMVLLPQDEYQPFSTHPAHKVESGVLSLLWDHHHQNGEHAICHTCSHYTQRWLLEANQSTTTSTITEDWWPPRSTVLTPQDAIYTDLTSRYYVPTYDPFVQWWSWYFATYPYSSLSIVPLVVNLMCMLFYYCGGGKKPTPPPPSMHMCYDPAPVMPSPPPQQSNTQYNSEQSSSGLHNRYTHEY